MYECMGTFVAYGQQSLEYPSDIENTSLRAVLSLQLSRDRHTLLEPRTPR
ncbi:unnamed protein product [Ectocarpus sp. CCAP 1310/34]|nr:unnamed protein product [Ectocarpus sp. CCAP 1310/34]